MYLLVFFHECILQQYRAMYNILPDLVVHIHFYL